MMAVTLAVEFFRQNYWSYTLSLGFAAPDLLRPEVSLVGAISAFRGAGDVRSLE